MLLEDITTGLACLARFDAAFLSISHRARPLAPVFLTITRTPATSVYRSNLLLSSRLNELARLFILFGLLLQLNIPIRSLCANSFPNIVRKERQANSQRRPNLEDV